MTRKQIACLLLSVPALLLMLTIPRSSRAAEELGGGHPSAAEAGRQLAASCTGCHRDDLKGGPARSPGQPAVPDITAAARRWTETQFVQALRTGKTPSGYQLRNEVMPWKMTADYSNSELHLLYEYLRKK